MKKTKLKKVKRSRKSPTEIKEEENDFELVEVKFESESFDEDIRPVSKHSFEETGRLKKVATAPLGASCPNDNSDFRNKSIEEVDDEELMVFPWSFPHSTRSKPKNN